MERIPILVDLVQRTSQRTVERLQTSVLPKLTDIATKFIHKKRQTKQPVAQKEYLQQEMEIVFEPTTIDANDAVTPFDHQYYNDENITPAWVFTEVADELKSLQREIEILEQKFKTEFEPIQEYSSYNTSPSTTSSHTGYDAARNSIEPEQNNIVTTSATPLVEPLPLITVFPLPQYGPPPPHRHPYISRIIRILPWILIYFTLVFTSYETYGVNEISHPGQQTVMPRPKEINACASINYTNRPNY